MRTPLLEAEIGVEIHQSRAGSDLHDPKVGSFANFDIGGSKIMGLTGK